MPGRIVQINVSRGGIPKRPVAEALIHHLGIDGDDQLHKQFHGGPQKALLLLAAEVIDELSNEGWPVFYGALGENLTTRGLDWKSWRPGQRFRTGAATLELTTPRKPCATLSAYGQGVQQRIFDSRVKDLDTTSPHWGMSGFYASIVEPSTVRTLDIIELVDAY